MLRVLVLYGTSEGHTAKIAEAMSNALNGIGIDTDVIEAGTVDPAIAGYSAVIVAGSVHAGSFQKSLIGLPPRQGRYGHDARLCLYRLERRQGVCR